VTGFPQFQDRREDSASSLTGRRFSHSTAQHGHACGRKKRNTIRRSLLPPLSSPSVQLGRHKKKTRRDDQTKPSAIARPRKHGPQPHSFISLSWKAWAWAGRFDSAADGDAPTCLRRPAHIRPRAIRPRVRASGTDSPACTFFSLAPRRPFFPSPADITTTSRPLPPQLRSPSPLVFPLRTFSRFQPSRQPRLARSRIPSKTVKAKPAKSRAAAAATRTRRTRAR
jgi:hypothetical protein